MKKRIIMAGLIFVFCCSTPSSIMAAEITKVPSKVYANTHATVRADKIDYVYKVINGKLYKRLYNFSQEKWVGDWVLA